MKTVVRSPWSGITSTSSTSVATFGQARQARYQQRLERAVAERRKMAALEQAGEKPLDQMGQLRGEQLERQIGRLQQAANSDEPDGRT